MSERSMRLPCRMDPLGELGSPGLWCLRQSLIGVPQSPLEAVAGVGDGCGLIDGFSWPSPFLHLALWEIRRVLEACARAELRVLVAVRR